MASESLADIVAEMRTKAECAPSYGDGIVMMLTDIANRLEAIAKRAYNDIDKAVCGIEDVSHYDIDGVRMAMDKTIGDYYE